MTASLPMISVVFITYRRITTLATTFSSFLHNTDYPRSRLELIVADDGSPMEVQEQIRALPFDRYIFGEKNLGIGGNTNRGLRAASGDLVLQLQDDWQCLGPHNYLRSAVDVLSLRSDISMIILRPHPRAIPVREVLNVANSCIRIFQNAPQTRISRVGAHAYTDWPHLKRRAFHDDLGLYREDLRMWETELDFSQRVNAQEVHFVADMGIDAFRHIGEDLSFNRGNRRSQIARIVQRWPGGGNLLNIWQTLKSQIKSKSTSGG